MSNKKLMITLVKKSSSELPLWARILFETPELLGEKMMKFRTRIRTQL